MLENKGSYWDVETLLRKFGSPSDSDDDNDALPYPEPLPRSSFLTPDFTPTAFLSSLHNRHQTLEDLRSELRQRSQELSKELLDLVNDNYQEFLGLGNDLRGGDEKVEEVRVGLLGFKRDIDSLKEKTASRRKEVEDLIKQRREVVEEIRLGKGLLEISERLEELESALGIGSAAKSNGKQEDGAGLDLGLDLSEESDSDTENSGSVIPLSRLTRRVEQYSETRRLARRVGSGHPFVHGQQHRIDKIEQTLLLDLASVLRQCQRARAQDKVLRVLKLYDSVGQSRRALAVLKNI